MKAASNFLVVLVIFLGALSAMAEEIFTSPIERIDDCIIYLSVALPVTPSEAYLYS